MRKTSVYLPDRLKDALAAHAGATGRSEAEVIRAAVEAEVRAGAGAAAGAPVIEAPVPGRLVGIGVDRIKRELLDAFDGGRRTEESTELLENGFRHDGSESQDGIAEASPRLGEVRIGPAVGPNR